MTRNPAFPVLLRTSLLLSALFLVACASACRKQLPASADALAQRPPLAPNGLPAEMRDAFYHLPEGGNFIPFNVFQALERPKSKDLFIKDLERFGFLPDTRSAENPRSLPVGMTIEEAPDLGIPLVGVNCTACHVGQIEYEGKRFQIDGAPNLVDYTAFNVELGEAMEATIAHPEKLFRFLHRYFHTRESTQSIFSELESYAAMARAGESMEDDFFDAISDHLKKEWDHYETLDPHRANIRARSVMFDVELESRGIDPVAIPESLPSSIDDEPKHDDFLKGLDAKERSTHLLSHYQTLLRDVHLVMARTHLLRMGLENSGAPMTTPGPGRFDAFGMVRNLSFGQYGPSPMTAPTSISPLWRIGDHAWYHFLGMTTTVVGRNIAAIDFIVTRNYETTLLIDNINELESMFRMLKEPDWPQFLPPLDEERIARGKVIFDGSEDRYRDTRLGNCASCHEAVQPYEHNPDLKTYRRFTPAELGVDPNLMHTYTNPLSEDLTLAQAIAEQVDGIEARFRETHGLTMEEYCEQYEYGRSRLTWDNSDTHPARQLHGVWATAPYLHNNSVPTLYALLSPADERPGSFAVGHREFDPVHVGYIANPEKVRFTFNVDEPVRDIQGNVHDIPNGNSNGGHEFGVDLSEEERLDLIEYLKTL